MEAMHDGRGLTLTAANPRAVEAFEDALEALLGARGGVERHVDEALRRDPHLILARCMRIALRLLHGDLEAAAADVVVLADDAAAHANDREHRHVRALQAWLAGDRHRALDHYGDLLTHYPRDILALHAAHALDFRLGSREALRDRVGRVAPHWHAGVPHYGYVLGMLAFGLEENGEYAVAEALAHRSLDLVPDNAAAMHVIAHVFEMQGRAADGIRFLESTRSTWSANQGFAVHIAWHLALFHIDRDAADRALTLHDEMIRPLRASPVAALIDASALLWRLELRGVDVGRRWAAVARAWRRKPLRRLRAFDLIHAMIAFVGADRQHAADGIVELLRADSVTRGASEPDEIALALPFCEALQAFGRNDYRLAVDKITAVRAQAADCGGSVAQCDLVHLTFLEAALRGRRARLARALAAERSARKPASLLNRWLFRRAGALQAAYAR